MRFVLILTVCSLYCFSSLAQVRSSLRMKYLPLHSDTVTLDTLSIAPLGFALRTTSGITLDTSYYTMDYASARLVWKRHKTDVLAPTDSVLATYRVLPMLFSESVKHKDVGLIGPDATGLVNNYLYTPSAKSGFDLLKSQGLSTSGSISRGISFGNNQDVFVNSSFNLQMAGKLSDDVTILAVVTDENLPLQPEGNTQQLQEFDKVFIQLTKDSSRLIAGDYELRRPDSYFMNFYKKNLGGYFTTRFKLNNKSAAPPLMRVGVSGAVSKGRFSRMTLTAIEGNQGPYLLRGSNNESFIIVLAGSEKVYLDGRLLVRGADEDYVIDYNTAEIVFTAKRFITKDARLIVEFEYSEKSYSRSLLYFNDELETRKMKLKFNFYSEQDSRNQPLLIELDSARQQVMSDAGDNIDSAFHFTADSVAFTTDLVLYQKKDTVAASGTYAGIYVYSVDPDSAHWKVTFSNVGQGRGDYVQAPAAANGRVFRWVEPAGGIPQGNFAPVALLITPKQQQLMTLGGDFSLSPSFRGGVETAMSHNDVNLFSSKDKENDVGYATKIFLQQSGRLDHDSAGWLIRNTANYEFSSTNFNPIERYRPVEFERDWNVNAGQAPHDEHFITFESFLENKSKGFVSYRLNSYLKGEEYKGLMNSLQGIYRTSRWKIAGAGSYLDTKGITASTKYLKHGLDISRALGALVVGVKEAQEDNRYRRPGIDSLQLNSFFFQEYSGYLATQESAKTRALLNYKYRIDEAPSGDDFRESARAQEVSVNLEFLANMNHQLKFNGTWRELNLTDSAKSNEQPSTLLSRVDYTANLLKGGITNSIFYEISTGQELKKEYSYLEVAPGQGSYTWQDYNSNGIKELNEFEIAAFASEANYVKIYLPTTEYVSTKGARFSDVLNINPAVFLKQKEGKVPFLAHFADQFSVALDKKSANDDFASSINPFNLAIDDSSLISTNSSLRNTLFFNRTHPVYGIDITWQRNDNKSLLVNGFESRAQRLYSMNVRWSFTSVWMVTAKGEAGEKANRSEFFSDRSYTLLFKSFEPKLTFQPDPATRLSLSYEYSNKENTFSENGETSTGHSINTEGRYSTVRMGILSAKFSYIQLTYNGQQNSSLAYDMLEGLSPGKNLTWSVSAQRSLGNSMQLSLNYDGHKSEGSPVVHVGGMQFRAFF